MFNEKEYNKKMLEYWERYQNGEKTAVISVQRYNRTLLKKEGVARQALAWTADEIVVCATMTLAEKAWG